MPLGKTILPFLDIHPDVEAALNENRPVVALESTIISHGMPWPDNVRTAVQVEQTVRDCGAIPATIAVINGRLKAGLTREEIEILGQSGSEVIKCSRRDLPYVCATQQHGATTVAATMIIAQLAGIQIFATGGIGGVHRGASQTFDISADLQELAHTSVAVVCAGAKSILDLPLTREYLETYGVPVLGYQTSSLPAFYTRTSSETVDYELNSADQIAEFLKVKWAMGLAGGVVIANPIPEAFAMPEAEINNAISTALQQANQQEIHGKAATPFLLEKVAELTSGQSLASNIQLVLNNARLASDIAKILCRQP